MKSSEEMMNSLLERRRVYNENKGVTGKRVALRTAPTTQASIIMRIDTGKQVDLKDPPPDEWDYVSYQGKTGWMMKKFLKEGE